MKTLSPTSSFKIYTALSILGALFSLYLLFHHIENKLGLSNGKSFCSINEIFDCDKVAQSPYSELFGIPIAGYGLFYFVVNLFILKLLKNSESDPKTWSLLKLLSLFGIIPSVILASISIILIKSICVVCFATYICAVALGALAFRLELDEGNFIVEGTKLFLNLIKNQLSIILAFLLIGALSLLAPLIVISQYRQEIPSLQVSNDNRAVEQWVSSKIYPQSQTIIAEGADRDVVFGPASSTVTVISYSDMACPHCKIIARELHELNEKYPFKLVFKDFPLDQHCNPLVTKPFHDFSCQAAKVARCALFTNPELYSEVHNTIYGLEDINAETLKPVLLQVSSSSEAATTCLNEPNYPASITRHVEEGISLKIAGTPAIFINGKMVPFPSPSALEKIIQLAVKTN